MRVPAVIRAGIGAGHGSRKQASIDLKGNSALPSVNIDISYLFEIAGCCSRTLPRSLTPSPISTSRRLIG